jgi:hypothetical protein
MTGMLSRSKVRVVELLDGDSHETPADDIRELLDHAVPLGYCEPSRPKSTRLRSRARWAFVVVAVIGTGAVGLYSTRRDPGPTPMPLRPTPTSESPAPASAPAPSATASDAGTPSGPASPAATVTPTAAPVDTSPQLPSGDGNQDGPQAPQAPQGPQGPPGPPGPQPATTGARPSPSSRSATPTPMLLGDFSGDHDLNRYCTERGFDQAFLPEATGSAYDSWLCRGGRPDELINFVAACRWAFPDRRVTGAAPLDETNPWTWRCYGH